MLRLFILLVAIAAVACGSAETKKSEPNLNGNVTNVASVSPTPMNSSDFTALRRFAESYEPKSGRVVIPSPPVLKPQLSELISNAAKTNSNAHEPFVLLIFLKLCRFQLEHFKQGYELGRENPLTKEFYRLIGETNYERAEFMDSFLAVDYVKEHPDLLEYAPIQFEMQRMDTARERIKRDALKE